MHALNNVNKVLQVLHQNNVSICCFFVAIVTSAAVWWMLLAKSETCGSEPGAFESAGFHFGHTVQHGTVRKREPQETVNLAALVFCCS